MLRYLMLILWLSLFFAFGLFAGKENDLFLDEGKIILNGEISKALGQYEDHLKGIIEFLVCSKGGKEYESLIVVDTDPKLIFDMVLSLGVERGGAATYDEDSDRMVGPKGTGFLIDVEWSVDNKETRVRAEELLYNVRTGKPMPYVAWIFSGSRQVYNVESDDEDELIPQAFITKSIVSLQNLDASALFQVPLLEAVENTYKKNDRLLPPLGTKVKLVIEMNRRVHLYLTITGKVQGVGFRYFTERNAKDLGLVGYVENLPTGQVEVVVEGDKLELDQFVQLMGKGPAIAKVSNVKVQERPLTEQYRTFEIR